MRCLILTITLLAVFTLSALAEVKPLEIGETPHNFWRHDITPHWNGRSLDDYDNRRINTDDSGQIQNEQQACINPMAPANRVVVWRDFRLGYRRVGVGYTFDYGETWTDALFPQMYYEQASDPVLVVDDLGVFTAMMISYNPGYTENGMLQISSYDGGITWRDSVWAAHTTDFSSFEDKEMLAVDTSALSPYYGSFYCVWSRFYSDGPGNFDSTKIVCTHKRLGEAYSEPIVVSPDQISLQWSNVAIGVNGEVYITWDGYEFGTWWNPAVWFSKSLDGGETFSTPSVIARPEFVHAEINPSLATYSFAPLGIDHSDGPHRGRLFMVYANSEQLVDLDIYFSYSDDLGDTWSEPAILNDDNVIFPADQFHPWLTVDEVGRVWVAFYDRRHDPNNLLMDLYFTVSEDGGETWRPNERITTESCNPGAGSLDAGLIGEYIGWTAFGNEALAVWTDTRLGNQDCFTAIIDSFFVDTSDAVNDGFIPHPSSLILSAFPNPTNSDVTLRYSVDVSAVIKLELFNTLGQVVRTTNLGAQLPGEYSIHENLASLATGLYLVRLSAGTQTTMTKVMLLK
ncbi:T9SS type A sorting domain-containing protein [bacterium]|nr:T9SS type A sorting domain-containing protein [bacterium]